MTEATYPAAGSKSPAQPHPSAFARSLVIGLMAFLTVVDLFATQAILPALVKAYNVSPAAMGTAVNASTIGMAIAGLAVSLLSRRLDRRMGVVASLAVLAVPTALLAAAPDLWTFTILRIAQGLCMSAAFTLTLAYLAESTSGADTAAAFAAYISGNVASNLFGRMMAASAVDALGLAANFYLFAGLNLLGAVLAYFTLTRMRHMAVAHTAASSPYAIWRQHLSNPALRATFAIGFCILFAFVGTFTYVNFVLTRPPLSIGMQALGVVYLVFLPSIITTPFAGRVAAGLGARRTLWAALGLALVGLPLLLWPAKVPVLAGLMLIGVGTFFAQATATGYVGRTATSDPGSASGLYLAAYFLGGLAGSAVLGFLFVTFGWPACVAGVGASLALAALLATRLD